MNQSVDYGMDDVMNAINSLFRKPTVLLVIQKDCKTEIYLETSNQGENQLE
jgi:hypothetical protein